MKKNVAVMLLGATLLLLTSGIAYGYWTDKLQLKLEIPLIYNLEITVNEPEDSVIQVHEKNLDNTEDEAAKADGGSDNAGSSVEEDDIASDGGWESEDIDLELGGSE